MGKIYYIMGKSASGKDTVYKKILGGCAKMNKIVLYTTRPKRDGEVNGEAYYFTSEEQINQFEKTRQLIEQRTYNTVEGPWSYATIDDGQINLDKRNYIVIGTLASYKKVRDYFGQDNVVPIFVQLDPGIRLQRALNRENMQKHPKYAEMCRRFIADEEDFSEEKLYDAGIRKRYINEDLNQCLAQISDDTKLEIKKI